MAFDGEVSGFDIDDDEVLWYAVAVTEWNGVFDNAAEFWLVFDDVCAFGGFDDGRAEWRVDGLVFLWVLHEKDVFFADFGDVAFPLRIWQGVRVAFFGDNFAEDGVFCFIDDFESEGALFADDVADDWLFAVC